MLSPVWLNVLSSSFNRFPRSLSHLPLVLDSPRWAALLPRPSLVFLMPLPLPLPLKVRTLPLTKRKSGPSVGKETHITRMQPSPRPNISRSGIRSNRLSSVRRTIWCKKKPPTSGVFSQYYKNLSEDCQFIDGKDESQYAKAQRDRN